MSQKPSQLLESFTALTKAGLYTDILQKYPYTFLDGLPQDQTAAFMKDIGEASARAKAAGIINYEQRTKEIDSVVANIRRSVQLNWQDGWEEQVRSSFISSWIPWVTYLGYPG